MQRRRRYDTPFRSRVLVTHVEVTLDNEPSVTAPVKSGDVEPSIETTTGSDREAPLAFELKFAVTDETMSAC
jgi:hypothetical protein